MTRYLLAFLLGFLTAPVVALLIFAWACAKGETR